MRKPLLGALACVGLLASCDKNEENPGWSIQLETMNLITPATGDPYAAKGKYVFKFNSEDVTLAIAGSDLNLGGHNVEFSTPESKYDANFYQEGSIYSFSFPSGAIASSAAEL